MRIKKYLLALPLILAAPSLYAVEISNGISLNGKAEADLIGETNQQTSNDGTSPMGRVEFDLITELSGVHPIDGNNNAVIWKVAKKIATDERYDVDGWREAWGGIQFKMFTLTIGNQFSNMYLRKDAAASYGLSHLYSDYGIEEVQHSRSATIMAQLGGGVKAVAQYNLGGAGVARPGSKNAGEMQKSDAWEAMLMFDNTDAGISASAGYYQGKNNGTLNMVSDNFNGSRQDQTSDISGLTNNSSAIYVDFSMVLPGNVDFTVSWTRNIWKGETIWGDMNNPTIIDSDGHAVNDQILGRIGIGLGEKNYVSVGYTVFTKLKDDSRVYSNAIQSAAIQYNRGLSNNATAFIQARHTMYDGNAAVTIPVDNIAASEDNVTKLTLGLIVTF